MKVIELRAENFKRLTAVRIHPNDGVTRIIGKNEAGKTSVLDAIAAALGGLTHSPEMPIRDGAEKAEVIIDLDDIVVRRRWTKNDSKLEVMAKDGAKYPSPQAVLDKLVGELAFDPLAFGRMKPQEQASTLARIAGVDLDAFAAKRKTIYDRRALVNKQAKELRAQLSALPPTRPNTPDEEESIIVAMAELTKAQQHNAAIATADNIVQQKTETWGVAKSKVSRIEEELSTARKQADLAGEAAGVARVARESMPAAIDVEPIQQRAAQVENVNRAVRAKKDRAAKEFQATKHEFDSEAFTTELDSLDKTKNDAVAAVQLPVDGLALTEAGVTIDKIPFSQCSGAQRLRTSTCIGLALKPKAELKLALIRDGSLLDDDGMRLMEEIADELGAQLFIERVANEGEVGVLIVDGESVEALATMEHAA